MSSLFDVPQQLVVILHLAAVSGGDLAPHQAISTHVLERRAESEDGTIAFSEQVWLRALKDGAGGDDLQPLALRIFKTSGGRYYVPAEGERNRILAQRRDADLAGLVAFDFAKGNAVSIEAVTRRAPTVADLYLAHVLGPETVIELLLLAKQHPDDDLAARLPELGKMAPEMLDAGDRPATARVALSRLTRAIDRAMAVARVSPVALKGSANGAGEPKPVAMTGFASLDWRTEVHPAN